MAFFDGHLRGLGRISETHLSALDEHLARHPEVWAADADKPNRFGAFKGTTAHVVFQYPLDLRRHTASAYRPLWADWEGVVAPIIAEATAGYNFADGRTSRIMLAKLKAGGTIGLHIDENPAAEVPHKIHVPLQTHPSVQFLAGRMGYHLKRGFAYEVNNRVRHGGRNPSAQDRVHLIFDYYDAAT